MFDMFLSKVGFILKSVFSNTNKKDQLAIQNISYSTLQALPTW